MLHNRGYAKVRSTEPHLSRETDSLQRLLTPVEHARVKGIPEQLIAGASTTLAHEALGQSILFGHAVAIGDALGIHLQALPAIETLPRYRRDAVTLAIEFIPASEPDEPSGMAP